MNQKNHKNHLRDKILSHRNTLHYDLVQKLNEQINSQLLQLSSEHDLNIGSYISINNEVSTDILTECFPNSHFYIPKIDPKECGKMAFTPLKHLETYANSHGIPETETFLDAIEPSQLDLVFMPLVGFDRKGNRLGYGGGYYDRTFSFRLNQSQIKPKLIALAYDFQELESIPHDTWDIKPNLILTNKEKILFDS